MESDAIIPPQFPGRVIKRDDEDKGVVLAIQHRLNELGCGPIDEDGEFGNQTFNAVKLFQSRFTDADGLPLEVDGEVGALTWAALFGASTVPANKDAASSLLIATLEFAATQIGVLENPEGSNRGPQVDKYVASVGLDPTGKFAWCVAFMFFCFEEASKQLSRANPMIKTAGVLDHWNKAGIRGIPRIKTNQAINNPALVRSGQIFVIDTRNGFGHSGFVESIAGNKLVTIEGNTNEGGNRNGIGVFRRSARKISSINRGFIDYNGF
jgi:hypothetical protein